MAIKIAATDKELSENGGLLLADKLFLKSCVAARVQHALPKLKVAAGRSVEKFRHLALGFIAGAECLDDMDRIAEDPAYQAIAKETFTARSYGNYLRSFQQIHCKTLNTELIKLSLDLRSRLFPKQDSYTLFLDSAINQQWGKKMEGVEMTYKGISGLDTFEAFDEKGFQYWHYVREGTTFSANSCSEVIHNVFNAMAGKPDFQRVRRYVLADAAFCNTEFFNACIAKHAGFITPLKSDMRDTVLGQIRQWEPQNAGKKNRVLFHDGRECEFGETLYTLENCAQVLRVVVIRAVRPVVPGALFKATEYDYHAWITNIGEHELSSSKIILKYRKRSDGENFIKELKGGFDLKNYPCQKLLANRAYGLIAAFAHTMLRFISLMRNPQRPHFAKLIRHLLIHLPVHVVRHAGIITFNFAQRHFQEVQRIRDSLLQMQFD